MRRALQSLETQDVSPHPPRRQRLRISNACHTCRLRKVKCDGSRSACDREPLQNKEWLDVPMSSIQFSAGPRLERKEKLEKSSHPLDPTGASSRVQVYVPATRRSPETPPTPHTGAASSTSRQCSGPDLPEEQGSEKSQACYTAHGRFAGEVAAAIDVRAGVAPATTSHLVPFVDAPLFGDVDLHAPCRGLDNPANQLPPRMYADYLVSIYWQHVDPVESILDRYRFFQGYNASFSNLGTLPDCDKDTWLSTLNMVFALAVQRQESVPLQNRDEQGNRFFRQAWFLLNPTTILWQPGSIELVQCLMLINRYLHCTNNQQKTWMTAGLAIRIAQSMCCHLPESSTSSKSSSDQKLKRKVWASCIALDRCVSWSLGRTSAQSLIPLPNRIGAATHSDRDVQQADEESVATTRGLELFEIGSQIQLAQTQTRNTTASKLGLPRLYQQDEYHAVAVQLEACLNRWESALPDDWKLENVVKSGDTAYRAEKCMLHLRHYHSRIFLYRPLLAQFYSVKTDGTAKHGLPTRSSLSDRLVKECAVSCVETAQKIASLITETLEPKEPIGLLPWWCRIYYLHIAGITFLAAMFTSDLYVDSVAHSWTQVMTALRLHEHLSIYVQQCIKTFETLSARILQSRDGSVHDMRDVALEDGPCSFLLNDGINDVGFDFNNFLFGADDFLSYRE